MERELLEKILVAQVLILGQTLKTNKNLAGTQTSSDFISEAIKLIQKEKGPILNEILSPLKSAEGHA